MSGGIFTASCATAVVIALAAGCGNDSPGAPTPGGGGGGGSTSEATITITSSGVSPKALTVARGTQVRFTNNDSVPHQMNSDPHPTHGSCPPIDDIGLLSAGQSKLTGNLNTAGTCGYHDHNRDTDTSLQGTVTIQ